MISSIHYITRIRITATLVTVFLALMVPAYAFAASIGIGLGASYFENPSRNDIQRVNSFIDDTHHQRQLTFGLHVQFVLPEPWFITTELSRVGTLHSVYKGQNNAQSIHIDSYQTLVSAQSAIGYTAELSKTLHAYASFGLAITETKYHVKQKVIYTNGTSTKQNDSQYKSQYLPTPLVGSGLLYKYSDVVTLKFAYEYLHLTGKNTTIHSFYIANSTKNPKTEGLRSHRLVLYLLFPTY